MKLGSQLSRHLLGAVLLLGLTSAALAKPPNIILILTDDQGWNNTEIPMIPSRADSRSAIRDRSFSRFEALSPPPTRTPSGLDVSRASAPTPRRASARSHDLAPGFEALLRGRRINASRTDSPSASCPSHG